MNKKTFATRATPKEWRVRKTVIFVLALAVVGLASALLAPRAQAAEPVQVPLTITQVLSSDGSAPAPENATFSYRLTAQGATSVLPEASDADGYVFTLTGNTTGGIAPVAFPGPGIYRYELRCVSQAQVGFVTDSQVYAIEVYVTSDSEVLAVVTSKDGNKTSAVTFIQRYSARASDPDVMVDPPVQKTVTGSPAAVSTFLFQLRALDASNPMPAGSVSGVKTIEISGSGQSEFGVWSYTREGIYRYTVSEVDTHAQGYGYDRAVYTITDNVSDQGGQLIVERIVTDDSGARTDRCAFTNHYSVIRAAAGSLMPKTGDSARFALYCGLFALAVLAAVTLYIVGRRAEAGNKRAQEFSGQ